MKLLFALILCVCALAHENHMTRYLSQVQALHGADPQWIHFVKFTKDHHRNYASAAELSTRFDNFKIVMERAAVFAQRNPLATFGVNKFADIHPDEFSRTHLMPNRPPRVMEGPFWFDTHPRPVFDNSSIDWCKDKGACTDIKDQGQCGSCWAFSATETIESYLILGGDKSPLQTPLGPQQIVDCDKSSNGCNGGDPATAIDYVGNAPGQETESVYPYTAQDGSCVFDPSQVTIKGTQNVKQSVVASGEESQLQAFLQSTGPPSVCVDANSWQSYTGGVLTDCGQQIDHAVQATGIDGENNAYIVRNSWGPSWGESGYIRIQMGQNLCLIANEVTWVTV